MIPRPCSSSFWQSPTSLPSTRPSITPSAYPSLTPTVTPTPSPSTSPSLLPSQVRVWRVMTVIHAHVDHFQERLSPWISSPLYRWGTLSIPTSFPPQSPTLGPSALPSKSPTLRPTTFPGTSVCIGSGRTVRNSTMLNAYLTAWSTPAVSGCPCVPPRTTSYFLLNLPHPPFRSPTRAAATASSTSTPPPSA